MEGEGPETLGPRITSVYVNVIKCCKGSISKSLCERPLQVLGAKDLPETLKVLSADGAAVAQLAERRPGKAEVPGSNPGGGSTPSQPPCITDGAIQHPPHGRGFPTRDSLVEHLSLAADERHALLWAIVARPGRYEGYREANKRRKQLLEKLMVER